MTTKLTFLNVETIAIFGQKVSNIGRLKMLERITREVCMCSNSDGREPSISLSDMNSVVKLERKDISGGDLPLKTTHLKLQCLALSICCAIASIMPFTFVDAKGQPPICCVGVQFP